LRLIRANPANRASDGDASLIGGDIELQVDVGRRVAFEDDIGQFGVGEPLLGGRNLITAGHRKAGERVCARRIALRSALQTRLGIPNSDLYSHHRRLSAVCNLAVDGRRVGRLGGQ